MGSGIDAGAFAQGFASGFRLVDDAIDKREKREMAKKAEVARVNALAKSDFKDFTTSFDTKIGEMMKYSIASSKATSLQEKNENIKAGNASIASLEAGLSNLKVTPQMQSYFNEVHSKNPDLFEQKDLLEHISINGKRMEVPAYIAKDYSKNSSMYMVDANGVMNRYTEMSSDSKEPNREGGITPVGREVVSDDDKHTGYTKRTFDSYTPSEQEKLSKAGYKSGDEITNNIAKSYLDESVDKSNKTSRENQKMEFWEKSNARLKESDAEEYEKRRSEYASKISTSTVAGTSAVKNETDGSIVDSIIENNISISSDANLKTSDINKLKASQKKMHRKLKTPILNEVLKVQKGLKSSERVISSMDDIEKDISKDMKNDILKKGGWDNTVQKVTSMTGFSEEDRQQISGINVNTKLGLVQARFVKAMSGATVSDKERAFYGEIFGSNFWNDETALREQIKVLNAKFKEEHMLEAEQNKDYLPYEYNKSLKYKKKKKNKPTISQVKARYPNMSEEEIKKRLGL